jgi:nucleotide-binding universal stress UspA family protein
MSGHILVGVDGSPASDAAIAWAVAEARLRGTGLQFLTAYRFPLAFAGTGANPSLAAPDEQRDAEQILDAAIRDAGSALDGMDVERRVVPGEAPGHALVDASEHAELLVLGVRGRGGLSGIALGSVSRHCVGRAHCPVVIVPAPD